MLIKCITVTCNLIHVFADWFDMDLLLLWKGVLLAELNIKGEMGPSINGIYKVYLPSKLI